MSEKNHFTNFTLDEKVIGEKVWLVIGCEDYSLDWELGFQRINQEFFCVKEMVENMGGEFDYDIEFGKRVKMELRLPMKDLETCRFYKKKFIEEDLPKSLDGWLSEYIRNK